MGWAVVFLGCPFFRGPSLLGPPPKFPGGPVLLGPLWLFQSPQSGWTVVLGLGLLSPAAPSGWVMYLFGPPQSQWTEAIRTGFLCSSGPGPFFPATPFFWRSQSHLGRFVVPSPT